MHWEEEKKRKCRICGGEKQSWEHVWEGCIDKEMRKESWQDVVGRMLGEDGGREEWMKEVERARKGEDWEKKGSEGEKEEEK